MKTIGMLLAVIAAGLCITAVSIAGGDRQTLVPPPDAAAESFARALMQGRYDPAARHLSKGLETSAGRDHLRAWFDPIRQRLGQSHTVEAAVEWMLGNEAAARALVDARYGTVVLHLRMIREHGLWVIDELPADVPVGITSRVLSGVLR